MADIEFINLSEAPNPPPESGSKNEYDEYVAQLEPGKAIRIAVSSNPKGAGSIKMKVNNASDRVGKEVRYWTDPDKQNVYVALVNNVPTSNGHNN
jgi:hypothetical protein